jgi:P-type Cu2+ transporter
MKTSVMEVRDMLSVLSVQGVEDRIGDVPGVESVTVNFSAGNATVRYDETRLDIADIKSDVRQRGYDEEAAPGASGKSAGRGPHDHAAPAVPASPPTTAASKPSAAKPAEPASAGADASGATGAKAPDKAAQPAAAPSVPEAAATEHATPGGGEKMSMPDKG